MYDAIIPAALVDKLVAAKYSPTELASPEAFESNPKLVWDWYAIQRRLVETPGIMRYVMFSCRSAPRAS